MHMLTVIVEGKRYLHTLIFEETRLHGIPSDLPYSTQIVVEPRFKGRFDSMVQAEVENVQIEWERAEEWVGEEILWCEWQIQMINELTVQADSAGVVPKS